MFNSRSGASNSAAAPQPASIESIRRQARHRLIGASVLVLIGVVGLPLLFDKAPRPLPADLAIQVQAATPPLPAAPSVSPAAPTPVATPTATPATPVRVEPVEEVIPSTPPPSPPVAAVPPPPAPTSRPAPVATPVAPTAAATPTPPATPAGARLVVQVGAFAEQSRAQEVRRRLEAAGLKTYTQVANTADGPRIRVRLGPFDTRAEADRAAQAVQRLGLTASVLTL